MYCQERRLYRVKSSENEHSGVSVSVEPTVRVRSSSSVDVAANNVCNRLCEMGLLKGGQNELHNTCVKRAHLPQCTKGKAYGNCNSNV